MVSKGGGGGDGDGGRRKCVLCGGDGKLTSGGVLLGEEVEALIDVALVQTPHQEIQLALLVVP